MAEKKKAQTQDKSAMGVKELAVELRSALEKRGKLEFQHKVAALKNPLELRHVRREIARIKTYLHMTEAKGSTPVIKTKKTLKEAAK